MKQIIITGLVICGLLYSCGKSGSPAPTGTGTGTGIKTGTGTDTGTTETKPEFVLKLTSTNQTDLDASGDVTSAKYLIEKPDNTTTYLNFGIGGKIRLELKNFATGTLRYDGDDYAKDYYPTNIFKARDRDPAIADTSKFACVKIIDPSAKDASMGQPLITFLFLDNSGGAGAGSLGLVSDAKIPVMDGKTLVKLINRTDYKHQ